MGLLARATHTLPLGTARQVTCLSTRNEQFTPYRHEPSICLFSKDECFGGIQKIREQELKAQYVLYVLYVHFFL